MEHCKNDLLEQLDQDMVDNHASRVGEHDLYRPLGPLYKFRPFTMSRPLENLGLRWRQSPTSPVFLPSLRSPKRIPSRGDRVEVTANLSTRPKI